MNVVVVDKPVDVLTHSKVALNDEFTVAEFCAHSQSYHRDTNRWHNTQSSIATRVVY